LKGRDGGRGRGGKLRQRWALWILVVSILSNLPASFARLHFSILILEMKKTDEVHRYKSHTVPSGLWRKKALSITFIKLK